MEKFLDKIFMVVKALAQPLPLKTSKYRPWVQALIDVSFIFVFLYLFIMIKECFFVGFPDQRSNYGFFRIPILMVTFYGSISCFVYFIARFVIKRPVVGIIIAITLQINAFMMGGIGSVRGRWSWIYIDGHMTLYGVFYELVSPWTLMAIYSLVLCIKQVKFYLSHNN